MNELSLSETFWFWVVSIEAQFPIFLVHILNLFSKGTSSSFMSPWSMGFDFRIYFYGEEISFE